VIREKRQKDGTTYQLVDKQDSSGANLLDIAQEDEEEAVSSSDAQRAEEMKVRARLLGNPLINYWRRL
jgi:hypothetical protein